MGGILVVLTSVILYGLVHLITEKVVSYLVRKQLKK